MREREGVGCCTQIALPPRAIVSFFRRYEAQAEAPLSRDNKTSRGPSIASLRPLVAKARMAIGMAALEPPFLRSTGFNAPAWIALLDSVSLLITRHVLSERAIAAACCCQRARPIVPPTWPCRTSTLECVLEDDVFVNESTWDPEFIDAFRIVYAQIVAALQRLSVNVAVSLCFGGGWTRACNSNPPMPGSATNPVRLWSRLTGLQR